MKTYRDEQGDKVIAITGGELIELGNVEMPLVALGIVLGIDDRELQQKWFRMWGEIVLQAKVTGEKIEPLDLASMIIENDMDKEALDMMIAVLKAADALDESTSDRRAFLHVISAAPLDAIRQAIDQMIQERN